MIAVIEYEENKPKLCVVGFSSDHEAREWANTYIKLADLPPSARVEVEDIDPALVVPQQLLN